MQTLDTKEKIFLKFRKRSKPQQNNHLAIAKL